MEWTKNSNYEELDFYSDDYVAISWHDRTIGSLSGNISTKGEKRSQYIAFTCDRYVDGVDLNDMLLQIQYKTEGSASVDAPVNVSYNDEKIRFGWVIPYNATIRAGEIKVMVFAVGSVNAGTSIESYTIKTKAYTYMINDTLDVADGLPEPDEDWYIQFINRAKGMLDSYTAQKESEIATKTNTSKSEITALTNTSKAEITAKGQEVLASIPEDYTQLSETIADNRDNGYLGQNLLNPTLKTTTSNGITCTDNGDGTYTVNGTASGGNAFFNMNTDIPFESGKTYKLVGLPQGAPSGVDNIVRSKTDSSSASTETGNGTTYTPTTNMWVFLRISNGTKVTNLIYKPMLTTDLSATYNDFIPYSKSNVELTNDVNTLSDEIATLTKSSASASGTIGLTKNNVNKYGKVVAVDIQFELTSVPTAWTSVAELPYATANEYSFFELIQSGQPLTTVGHAMVNVLGGKTLKIPKDIPLGTYWIHGTYMTTD